MSIRVGSGLPLSGMVTWDADLSRQTVDGARTLTTFPKGFFASEGLTLPPGACRRPGCRMSRPGRLPCPRPRGWSHPRR